MGWGVQAIAVASWDWELGELLSALGHRHQTVVLAIGHVKGAVRFGGYGDGDVELSRTRALAAQRGNRFSDQ